MSPTSVNGGGRVSGHHLLQSAMLTFYLFIYWANITIAKGVLWLLRNLKIKM